MFSFTLQDVVNIFPIFLCERYERHLGIILHTVILFSSLYIIRVEKTYVPNGY